MPYKDADPERARVACVFGLGGGELHVADERFPDEWDGHIAYWYDGVPEYAGELRHLDDARTAIICCLFGPVTHFVHTPSAAEQQPSTTSPARYSVGVKLHMPRSRHAVVPLQSAALVGLHSPNV